MRTTYNRIDYGDIAVRYNGSRAGDLIRVGRVSNITQFRKTLEGRGLGSDDMHVFNREGVCYVKKLSSNEMRYR